MRVLSIVGARPQFIKAAVLVRAFAEFAERTGERVDHRLLHTGQHHSAGLSDVFFEQLSLPAPHVSLGIGSGKHGLQTGSMMASIEASLDAWRPEFLLIYGDTNSTLAGALAGCKMHIPVVHLEAGLRSFDRRMPEEINRIVSDHVSECLLCPTETAMQNLQREGRGEASVLVGDVMLDAVNLYAERASSGEREALGLQAKSYALVTLHRAANTDDEDKLDEFVSLLAEMPLPVVLPMHPRLEKCLGLGRIQQLLRHRHVHLLPPAGYLEMLGLERDAKVILTDSGGVQKEAYFLGVPCVTLRDETEWVETVHDRWNSVVGLDRRRALAAVGELRSENGARRELPRDLARFGNGRAGQACVEAVMQLRGGVLCGRY